MCLTDLYFLKLYLYGREGWYIGEVVPQVFDLPGLILSLGFYPIVNEDACETGATKEALLRIHRHELHGEG